MAAAAAFRASRVDMMQAGVPEDYVDALLDDKYMADLIESTNRRMNKRAQKMQKYILLQKLIFWILVAQALLGIWVALYKSVLQPDKLEGIHTTLEDVDIILMLDASKQMNLIREKQHAAAEKFTGMFNMAMRQHKKEKRSEAVEALNRKERDKGGLLPFLKRFGPRQPSAESLVAVRGARLRVATGIFNAEGAQLLHDLTGDFRKQHSALAEVQKGSYQSLAFWHTALQVCNRTAEEQSSTRNRKRYCAILGDDSAMCARVDAPGVDSHCKKWRKGVCPEPDGDVGQSLLEWSEELDRCTEYANTGLTQIETIMMFTVGSSQEGQQRLKNPSFQRFVKETTNCTIKKETEPLESSSGVRSVQERFVYDEGCERFIMGNSFDDLTQKSEQLANLLKGNVVETERVNNGNDKRYIWFLLLVLNLVFYVLWTKILQCVNSVRTKAEQAMGKKKKVIKVTKMLVEKDPDDGLQQQRDGFSEVELAEMASLQPLMELGAPMLLRARLKGGYLRADEKQGVPDGNGHASDANSNWTFEQVEGEGQEDERGHRVRIRNARGEVLIADSEGVRFAPLSKATGQDAAEAGEAAEFLLQQAKGEAEGEAYRLGDTMQLQSCGTGKYLRVQKDGTCNAMGEVDQPETQFVVDSGGPSIHSGSVVTLTSVMTNAFMKGMPDGDVDALPGGEEWRFWKLEKKGAESSAAPLSSVDMSGSSGHGNLKEGDVVTLRGFNQHMLAVEESGAVSCGRRLGDAEAAESSAAAAAAGVGADETTQDFVISRVGMHLVRKHDQSIRSGMQVCLKPLRGPSADRAAAEQEENNNNNSSNSHLDCLRVNGDGSVTADGKVTQREITLTLNLSKVTEMLMPLHSTLQKGDVNILVSPLWNKSDVKKLNAMTSHWTKDEDLDQFKGPVVVASEKGTYVVPKARGVDSGWVAVVNEGVDIPKAARQAKLQGASGLIVRCEDVLSIEKIRKNKDTVAPDLPTVFCDQATGEALDERGLVLNGCEFKRKYVTDAVRALGGAARGAQGGDDVFHKLGAGMLERRKERQEEEAEAEAQTVIQQVVEEEEGQYKWKVQSNTHYLWGKSGGGAAVMKVNFGAAPPPSAVQRTKATADASQTRARRPTLTRAASGRRSIAGVALLEAEDVKGKRLARDLSQVLASEEVADEAEYQFEQLAEDSDFKIEYHFDEVEVAKGAQLEEVEEQEIMAEQKAVIAKFGVPLKMFWLVVVGLVVSTTLLLIILSCTLLSDPAAMDAGEEDWEEEVSLPVLLMAQQRLPGSFLSLHPR